LKDSPSRGSRSLFAIEKASDVEVLLFLARFAFSLSHARSIKEAQALGQTGMNLIGHAVDLAQIVGVDATSEGVVCAARS
jgi:hypothetical protein